MLEQLLRERLDALGAPAVRFSTELMQFVQQDDGQIRVKMRNTQTDEEYTKTYRYLIGCDGAHSTVRHMLNWQLRAKTYPEYFQAG